MNCLFFYLDNLIDELYFDRPVQAGDLIETLVAQMYPGRCADALPFPATAFRDLWQTGIHGTSWQWQSRMADAWTRYLWANLAEATDRRRGTVPKSLEQYLRMRRTSIGVSPSLGMVERASRFEICARAYHQSAIQRLETLTCEIIALCNDIASLEKEEAQGDTYNAVIILYRFKGLTRDQALNHVIAMVRERAEEFHALSLQTPRLCEALELPPRERIAVARWVDGARTWIGGNLDWQRETPRYRTTHPVQHPTPSWNSTRQPFGVSSVWHTPPFDRSACAR
ncbi:terpene synthase family protein [Streptomyces sp. NBC_00882]|uniref:terpene synthase family protein n=1 Tax=Streptomyces TaxID=1883 RepID=UPI003863E152|nr:terpene synthase family protein [Streptomyces sp. NBC_00882]WSZ62075.1 terpene synthase family protein [Streptomyces canus]